MAHGLTQYFFPGGWNINIVPIELANDPTWRPIGAVTPFCPKDYGVDQYGRDRGTENFGYSRANFDNLIWAFDHYPEIEFQQQYAAEWNERHDLPAYIRPARLESDLPFIGNLNLTKADKPKGKPGRPRNDPNGPEDPIEYQRHRRREAYLKRKASRA